MNRICLKRKEMQRKNSIPSTDTENKEPDHINNINSGPAVQVYSASDKDEKQAPISTSCSNSSTIFEDFRKQYDELRILYDTKRQQFDNLAREKKKLEIQLLNFNPQYYEKQIKRLKEEVEKYQEENEDNKYKYIVAQNSKKQFQATAKMKSEDLKKALQQLEKQKVLVVEYKHQLVQKQRCFQRITSQMQKSNDVLAKNFEALATKSQKTEATLKTKSQQLDCSVKNNEFLAKKIAELEKVMQNNKEIYDQTNFTKTQKIQELDSKLRTLNRTSRDTIDGLEFKIQQIKNQRKTQNLFVDQRIETAASMKNQRMNQLEIVRLEDINKQIKADYDDKCELIKKLEQKLLKTYSYQDYQELEDKLHICEEENKRLSKSYEERIICQEKEIEMLKLQNIQKFPEEQYGQGNNDFRQILKRQLEQNTKIRAEVSQKVEELFNSKSQTEQYKYKLKCTHEDIVNLQKKIKALQKNHSIEMDVSEQNLRNEIDSLKRKIQMMNNKLENKSREVKEKENFIINTIIGRSRQEDVPLILAQLQRIFEIDYSAKLTAANSRILDLEKKLQTNQKFQ